MIYPLGMDCPKCGKQLTEDSFLPPEMMLCPAHGVVSISGSELELNHESYEMREMKRANRGRKWNGEMWRFLDMIRNAGISYLMVNGMGGEDPSVVCVENLEVSGLGRIDVEFRFGTLGKLESIRARQG